ncbi:MAG: sortase [Chloroflexi bacterium]|nr:sortase [Chloroflexota bacterium]
MRDKRPVDELSVEELERILAIKRREERMSRFRQHKDDQRTVNVPSNNHIQPVQHERAADVPAPMEPVSYDLTVDAPKFEDDLAVIEEKSYYLSEEPAFVEDIEEPQSRNRVITLPDGQKSPKQKAVEYALLALEIIFIGGLAIILYRAFVGLESIQDNTNRTQQELSQAIAQGRVTPSPTPILNVGNYILPGGHTPPDENGQSQFNYDELDNVPANVRPAIEREVLNNRVVAQPELPNDPVAIDIPAIDISNASIVGGDHWYALQSGIGHRIDSGRPGTDQNVVLTGHNDVYGEVFKRLEELQVGDEFSIRDNSGRQHTYRVTFSDDVAPTDVQVLDPNNGVGATLITCWPYRVNDRRWIVQAALVE